MNDQQRSLWNRIRAFEPDDPSATYPFSAKLADENGWTRAFTVRAIEEYKRFAFMSVAAGHVVCPSEEVDAVWHLHLTYTDSYWNHFCPEALGQPLHHHPSKGGTGELKKHIEMYERTLASYRRLFGQEPPADIWPPAARRFAAKTPPHDAWVVPKPAVRRAAVVVACAAAPFVLALSLAAASDDGASRSLNPFDLRGPQFLVFYVAAAVTGLVIAVLLRRTLRRPAGEPQTVPQLDAYELAYLAGGKAEAVNTALASLVYRQILHANAYGMSVTRTGLPPLSDTTHWLEQAVYDAVPATGSRRIRDLRLMLAPATEGLTVRLRGEGLIPSASQASQAQWLPALVALIAPAIGVVKIAVGIARDRPVLYLVLLVAISLAVVWSIFRRPVFTTRLGDAVLHCYRLAHAQLRQGWGRRATPGTRPPAEMSLAAALFGVGIFGGSSMAAFRRATDRSRNTDSGTTSDGGSSDTGGSGCGGASDGGGGGGGGGGCGGCGGGGGD